MNPFVDSVVQCWGCPVFDRLFQVVSLSAAAVYEKIVALATVLFVGFFAFYILYIFWKNMKDSGKGMLADPMYQKSVRPVVINALIVFTLLGLGVQVPRLISQITFEPVAQITTFYAQSVIQTSSETVAQKVPYEPAAMSPDGFYRPELRNKILELMKTTITQFQNFIKLGFAIMDRAFSWSALTSIGALLKHFLIFFMGAYLVIAFFRIFVRFCFYFVDAIVAFAFFAFFFPLSAVFFIFKNSDSAAWVKNMGDNFGPKFLKQGINGIVALGAAVITYTVAMVIIGKFFGGGDVTAMILSGDIYGSALDGSNLEAMTLLSFIVLVYVVQYLVGKIPDVAKEILNAFKVAPENKLGEAVAGDALNLTKLVYNSGKKVVDIIRDKK